MALFLLLRCHALICGARCPMDSYIEITTWQHLCKHTSIRKSWGTLTCAMLVDDIICGCVPHGGVALLHISSAVALCRTIVVL